MPLSFWIILWKCVLIGGLVLFAVMAIGVSIGGVRDIARLLETLRKDADDPPAGQSPGRSLGETHRQP